MLNQLENIFDNFRNVDQCSKDLITLLTTIGISYVSVKLVGWSWKLYQVAKLYFWSQYFSCCKTNLLHKYGQWVIISGSTDGIGLAMAKEFARRGHSILVIGRNEEKLAATKKMLEAEPNVAEIETIKIDLSDSSLENYERVREQIDPDNRDIGILVNNAGLFVDKFNRYNEHTLNKIKDIVNVNALGPALLTRIVLPSLVKNGKGLVVNVSSMAGCFTSPYMSVYGPSKSFVDHLSKLLHDEYGSRVDFVNLSPGGVQTKLYTQTRSVDKKTELFVPTPERYAKVAINALSARNNSYAGTLGHGLCIEICKSFTSLGFPVFKHLLRRVEPIPDLPPIVERKRN